MNIFLNLFYVFHIFGTFEHWFLLFNRLIISKRHYLLHFLLKCLRLYLHNKILNPSRIGFYVWCEVLQLHFFSIWIPVSLSFIDQLILSVLIGNAISHIWSVHVCTCLLLGNLLSIGLLVNYCNNDTQSSRSGLVRMCWNLVEQVQHPGPFRTVHDPSLFLINLSIILPGSKKNLIQITIEIEIIL